MIILDTNVVSALMRKDPDLAMVRWLDRQPVESLWLTSISVLEVLFGIAALQAGRRQRALEAAFRTVLEEDLGGRVLDFDRSAAVSAAVLAARRQRAGRPVDLRDTQIAGIALARHGTIATRNTRHFLDLVVPVVDPWEAEVA